MSVSRPTSFSWSTSSCWDDEKRTLDGLPGGGINIAHEAVDRHAATSRGDQVALRFIGGNDAPHDVTYGDLAVHTNRFANALRSLGLNKGERVFTLTGRIPELYTTALGVMKMGGVFCPLFSAFGPEPLYTRLSLGDAKVLVTTPMFYQRKVAPLRDRLPGLEHILITGDEPPPPGTTSFNAFINAATTNTDSVQGACAATMPDDPALLHFTSGTTGAPKGAVHVHGAVLAQQAGAHLALDLRPNDIYWCTADPGWVTGAVYGIIAPLVLGATTIVDEGEFDAEQWYRILETQKVNVWYTAPTAVRMLMKAGADLAGQFDLSALRFLASVGAPLNPEEVLWGRVVLGQPFHDTWWQTETGAIMIANTATQSIKPGSMGCPLPGITAGIVHRASDGGVEEITAPDTVGELALRAGWPSMFRTYLGEEARYQKCFADGWYLSGDLAKRDADGYYWFVGRADDMIKSAGHFIGPFEVESALMEHPAVAEVGVIGKPDPVAMEVVKAFVSLAPGHAASEELRRELLGFARQRLGAAVAPREIAFSTNLPKTPSGKIIRRILKARELGQPEGDTSTVLDEPSSP